MYILRHPEHCPLIMKHSVIALGNFDGVHRGHQEVIKTARTLADYYQTSCAVMTFEPHPMTVLRAGAPTIRITPFRTKTERIKMLQADILCAINFSEQFAALTAEEFIEQILVRCLNVRHVVIGEDFNFGRNRGGNPALLCQMADHYGFEVTCVPPVMQHAEICSSSRIRQYLKAGDIEKASALLGYDYTISGRVVSGDKRGRLLGFPTANIALPSALLKGAYGVYAVQISMDNGVCWHHAVANLGKRPSVSTSEEPTLEVHILDFNQDIYGQRVEVRFCHFLRSEQKFGSLEMLKAQIKQDIKQACIMLKGHPHHA